MKYQNDPKTFPRTGACPLCIDGHPVTEPTDCNCSCGHSVEYVALGGVWYDVEEINRDNPYTQQRQAGFKEAEALERRVPRALDTDPELRATVNRMKAILNKKPKL